MHVPDGFLDGKTLAAAGIFSGVGLGAAMWNVRRLSPRRVPLMGLSAAFIFAGQMLNFPVAGGTSGHLIGGVLAAVLLGPSAAVIILTAVLVIQCLLFADGGLLALGANVLNMGIVDSVGGYLVYRAVFRLLPGDRHSARVAAAAFAAWCGAVLASMVCSGELVASGTAKAHVAFPAMVGVHMAIGLGEAAITAIVIATISKTRPELLDERAGADRTGSGGFLVYGLIVAAALGVFVSPFACQWPDGLDHVAKVIGFGHREVERRSVITNYQFPGISNLRVATAVAGLVGTLLAFAVALGLSRVLMRSRAGTVTAGDEPALSGAAP